MAPFMSITGASSSADVPHRMKPPSVGVTVLPCSAILGFASAGSMTVMQCASVRSRPPSGPKASMRMRTLARSSSGNSAASSSGVCQTTVLPAFSAITPCAPPRK